MASLTASAVPSRSTTPSRSSSPAPYPPIVLTIRFVASIPDLDLPPTLPAETTALALIPIMRSRLSTQHASARIRLIYSGRVLSLTRPLTTSLRLPSAVKLGKAPAPFRSDEASSSASSDSPRLYIHATLGDALSADELAAETAAARRSVEALQPDPSPLNTARAGIDNTQTAHNEAAADTGSPTSAAQRTTRSTPQGFDRLTSAGFSAQEVASLRSQFLAIVAHTHTPDTMPSAADMRILEERWLDNDTGGSSFGEAGSDEDGGAAGLAGGGGGGFGDEDGRGLDDMLWGNVIGFFWPIGAVVWLMREEGVWSKRRQIAVLTGVFVNICISVLRAAG